MSSSTMGFEIRDSIHVCKERGIFASCDNACFDRDIDVIRCDCRSVVK